MMSPLCSSALSEHHAPSSDVQLDLDVNPRSNKKKIKIGVFLTLVEAHFD